MKPFLRALQRLAVECCLYTRAQQSGSISSTTCVGLVVVLATNMKSHGLAGLPDSCRCTGLEAVDMLAGPYTGTEQSCMAVMCIYC